MVKNTSSGDKTRPTKESDLSTTSDMSIASELPNRMDVACQGTQCRQHPQVTSGTETTEPEEENIEGLEFILESESALEEIRLEIYRRKELALLEIRKLAANTLTDKEE